MFSKIKEFLEGGAPVPEEAKVSVRVCFILAGVNFVLGSLAGFAIRSAFF